MLGRYEWKQVSWIKPGVKRGLRAEWEAGQGLQSSSWAANLHFPQHPASLCSLGDYLCCPGCAETMNTQPQAQCVNRHQVSTLDTSACTWSHRITFPGKVRGLLPAGKCP